MTSHNIAVLGIDAAWTERNPSGVALAVRDNDGWRTVVAEASYAAFLNPRIDGDAMLRPRGSKPDIGELVRVAEARAGCPVEVIAIDMPLSRVPILCRRRSDDAVSKAYGSRKCSTHTPNPERPGAVSEQMRRTAEAAGFPLQVSGPPRRGTIEVYPHPALVELFAAKERLPYKEAKIRAYWPGVDREGRRRLLLEQWSRIALALDRELPGAATQLELPSPGDSGWRLKAFEDRLDALVCAVVAKLYLESECVAFGDDDSAIWIPRPWAIALTRAS